MTETFSCTLTPDDPDAVAAFVAELRQQAEAAWPATLARILEQSRLSGLEVVYDVSRAGFAWSPAYRHGSEQPTAWICAATGERHDGPNSPEQDA